MMNEPHHKCVQTFFILFWIICFSATSSATSPLNPRNIQIVPISEHHRDLHNIFAGRTPKSSKTSKKSGKSTKTLKSSGEGDGTSDKSSKNSDEERNACEEPLETFRTCMPRWNGEVTDTSNSGRSGREIYVANKTPRETLYISMLGVNEPYEACMDQLDLEEEVLNFLNEKVVGNTWYPRCVLLQEVQYNPEGTTLGLTLTLDMDLSEYEKKDVSNTLTPQQEMLCEIRDAISEDETCFGVDIGSNERILEKIIHRNTAEQNDFLVAIGLNATSVFAALDQTDISTPFKCGINYNIVNGGGVAALTCDEYEELNCASFLNQIGDDVFEDTKEECLEPSSMPSFQPTALPSFEPSERPSNMPSSFPSTVPSNEPSAEPSSLPSFLPSVLPSGKPSVNPSSMPSSLPNALPSTMPNASPSMIPSMRPSNIPSIMPSSFPSAFPSSQPSIEPSSSPSLLPSISPSSEPSTEPSSLPSLFPSVLPSSEPSAKPSNIPSLLPSVLPSREPSAHPSSMPSSLPSSIPSITPTLSAKPSKVPSFMPSGKLELNETCTGNNNCESGRCANSICAEKLIDGSVCEEPNDCISQSCYFVGSGYTKSCGGVGLSSGVECTLDNNCDSGRCAIVPNPTFFEESQCTQTLGTGLTCIKDADCASGRCAINSTFTCEDKLPRGFACSRDSDCQTCKCLGNTCGGAKLANGQECLLDSQCASSRCSNSDFICIDKLPDGYSCGGNKDCVSNSCVPLDANIEWVRSCSGVALVNKQICADPSHCVSDSCSGNERCQDKLDNGETCIADYDCKSGRCSTTSDSCEDKLDIGDSCDENDDCYSNNCAANVLVPGKACGAYSGVPQGINTLCNADADCISGRCSKSACQNQLGDGFSCSKNSDCQSGSCLSISDSTSSCNGDLFVNGERCFIGSDCASGHCSFSFLCEAKLSDGYACRVNNDCASNSCISIGGFIRSCGGLDMVNGERCLSDSNCASGRCSSQLECADKLVNENTCFCDADCLSDYCSSSLVCENPPPCRDDQLDIFRTCRIGLNDPTVVYNSNATEPPTVESGRQLYVTNRDTETLYIAVDALSPFDNCYDKLALEAELLEFLADTLDADEGVIVRCIFIGDIVAGSKQRDGNNLERSSVSVVLTLEFDSETFDNSGTSNRKLFRTSSCSYSERQLCAARNSFDSSGSCCGSFRRRAMESTHRKDSQQNLFLDFLNSSYNLTSTDVAATFENPDATTVFECYFYRFFTLYSLTNPTCEDYLAYQEFSCEVFFSYDPGYVNLFEGYEDFCY